MSSQDNDQDNRVVAVVLISTILLAVGLALGMGIYKARSGSASGSGAATATAMAMAGDAAHGETDGGHSMVDGAMTAVAGAGAEASEAMQNAASEVSDAAADVASDAAATVQAAAGAVESAASGVADAVMPAQAVSGDEASVVMENGVVKFYFASGKSDLASGALAALGDAISAAKAGKRLVLSGFHDSTGSAALNADLAKKRAMAVHDALLTAGVAESSLELKKPEVSTGSGSAAEARRVEVTIVE
jgi:outer membrane protein OmpA-like peptidoglycan-associated protein